MDDTGSKETLSKKDHVCIKGIYSTQLSNVKMFIKGIETNLIKNLDRQNLKCIIYSMT